jgi:hypothetical protein
MDWLSDLWKYGFTAKQRAASRDAERYSRALTAYEGELAALTPAEARAAAERVLAAPRFIRTTPWHDAPPPHTELAPVLREFFQRIRLVEGPEAERCADAAALPLLEWAPGYLSLGTAGEHTHVAIRPGDESIYLLADDVPHDERVELVFATVYHWILWLERTEELLREPGPPAA